MTKIIFEIEHVNGAKGTMPRDVASPAAAVLSALTVYRGRCDVRSIDIFRVDIWTGARDRVAYLNSANVASFG